MLVPKLLVTPQKIRKFGPKTAKFGPKMAFLAHFITGNGQKRPKYVFLGTFLASSFGAFLVGGCGAWAVSRKTPIYFILYLAGRQNRRIHGKHFVLKVKVVLFRPKMIPFKFHKTPLKSPTLPRVPSGLSSRKALCHSSTSSEL